MIHITVYVNRFRQCSTSLYTADIQGGSKHGANLIFLSS